MRKLQKKKKIQFLLCALAKCYRERSLWTHLRTDAWFVMAFATYDGVHSSLFVARFEIQSDEMIHDYANVSQWNQEWQ